MDLHQVKLVFCCVVLQVQGQELMAERWEKGREPLGQLGVPAAWFLQHGLMQRLGANDMVLVPHKVFWHCTEVISLQMCSYFLCVALCVLGARQTQTALVLCPVASFSNPWVHQAGFLFLWKAVTFCFQFKSK